MNLGPKGKRSLEERLDDAVRILQARCDSGTLRFAEQRETETKIVQFNTALEKKKEQQKPIDDLQAKIKEIKDSMDDPESKELNERWAAIQAELDAIHAEQAEKGKNLDSLHAERKELQNLQREKFAAKKNLGDEYYKQRNAWRDYDREQRAKAQERYRAEQERIRKERKLERAQKMLAEASDPAYLDEIRRANSLLQYFDPSFVPEKAPLQPTTNLQAQAERKVDASDLQGAKILSSKKDREEELFPAQKKGKKGKKGKKQDAAATKTFNCPPSVLEDCSYLDIDPPMSAEEVPGVIEKVKSKLDNWKADQAAQTQKVRYAWHFAHPMEECAFVLTSLRQNIEKAKKEIERIEAEEANERNGKKSPSGPASPNGNAAASEEVKSDDKTEDTPKDAPEEVAEAVEQVSLEDNKEEEAVAAA